MAFNGQVLLRLKLGFFHVKRGEFASLIIFDNISGSASTKSSNARSPSSELIFSESIFFAMVGIAGKPLVSTEATLTTHCERQT